jgi:hypothetical protein
LATPETLEFNTIEDISRLENIALQLLKKYIDQYYNFHLKRYDNGSIVDTKYIHGKN